jgi:gamma-aminobutyric acid receptor subunit beta
VYFRLKRANQRGSNVRRGIQALRKRAKSFVPRIRDINIIDKYSRVVFPSSFVLFK